MLLLTVVTLGNHVFGYNDKVHDEMKRHRGRGVGGGIALLLTFVANVAMPFVTPSEVGNLYARKGQRPPVNGWTGLWVLVPTFVGQFVVFGVLLAVGLSQDVESDETSTGLAVGLVSTFVVYGLAVVAGGIVWLVKTDGALNRYWQTPQ